MAADESAFKIIEREQRQNGPDFSGRDFESLRREKELRQAAGQPTGDLDAALEKLAGKRKSNLSESVASVTRSA